MSRIGFPPTLFTALIRQGFIDIQSGKNLLINQNTTFQNGWCTSRSALSWAGKDYPGRPNCIICISFLGSTEDLEMINRVLQTMPGDHYLSLSFLGAKL